MPSGGVASPEPSSGMLISMSIDESPDLRALLLEVSEVAQNGLTYGKDRYDLDRYTRLREISAHLLSAHSGVGRESIEIFLESDVGYVTPKIDLRAAVFNDEGKVLLVEESDGFTLPGGWADPRETASEGAIRETLEETGWAIEILRLGAVLDSDRQGHPAPHPFSIYKIFFIARPLTFHPDENTNETGPHDFFDVDALPQLSSGRVNEDEIQFLKRMYEDSSIPAVFD